MNKYATTSIKHGMRQFKIYGLWQNMKRRCLQKTYHAYDRYGGRGIKLHPKWHTFEGFWEDVMPIYYRFVATNPGVKATIDRIDNDGNYEPGNIQFLTRGENARKDNLGGKSVRSKTTCQYTLDGKLIKEWGSAREAARGMGIKVQRISAVCRGESKTSHGYKWAYKTNN